MIGSVSIVQAFEHLGSQTHALYKCDKGGGGSVAFRGRRARHGVAVHCEERSRPHREQAIHEREQKHRGAALPHPASVSRNTTSALVNCVPSYAEHYEATVQVLLGQHWVCEV